jgi:TP901 family phage tail tape measure protein
LSELIAEARVLITPDTTAFRTQLIAQTTAAAKGVTVPVQVTPVATTGTGLAGQQAALRGVNDETRKGAEEAKRLAQTEREAAKEAAEHARQLRGLGKGAGSAALSLVGLRGATLASTAPFLAGAAAAVSFAKAVGLASEFQKQLAVLQATSGATATELEAVSEAAKQLGADVTLPSVSAIDAAQAMTELSKAGLSVQESIDGARGVLQLATAANIDNAAATELAASALNAFGLAGDQAVHVADVLANSANDAQGSINDIGIALQQSAAAGRQAGLSLEQTVGILTEFARAGIKGSDAGTSLRVLLLRLINPSKKAAEVIKELGLHIRDATGNINLGFFDEFARKTANLTKAERDRDAAIIAGQDAFRGLAILARAGGVEIDAQVDRLNKAGTAADLAAARTSGLAGATENLKNQLSTAGLAVGQSLTPALTDLVKAAGNAVQLTSSLVGEINDLRNAATKPIKLVVELITGDEDKGNAAESFAKRIAKQALFLGPALAQEANAAIDAIRGARADVQAEVARGSLPDILADLNKGGATPTGLDETVRKLQDMADRLKGGSAETEAFRKSIEAFIEQLQKLSTQPDIEVPIKLPKGLLDGTFGAKAAQTTQASFASELNKGDFGFGTFIQSLTNQGLQGFAAAGAAAGNTTGEAFKQALASSLSSLDLAVAQAGGNQGQELSILRERETRQQTFLDRVLQRPQNEKNVQLAIDAAKQLAQTRNAIQSILDQQAATAKQAAADVKSKAAAADQTFLQGLADARTEQENAIAKALQTPGTADDIAETEQQKALLVRQIALIRSSDLDQKQKNAAILALRTSVIATTGSLKQLHAADKQQRETQKQQALDAQIALAQAEGDTKEQIRLIDVQIANINKQIASEKLLGAALNTAKAQRATLRKQKEQLQQQQEDLQDQQRSDREALGQSIFDLTGNKNPLLKALNAEIADTRADIAAAKKAGQSTTLLETALNEFLLKRKNLLKETADKAKEGFSGFEFLQKTQGFASNLLGNLIPGFATGGLVGNTSAMQGQITDPALNRFQNDTVVGGSLSDRGVRPVQVDTTNMLLRQILRTLNGKANNPPEIQQNWRTAFAELDTL